MTQPPCRTLILLLALAPVVASAQVSRPEIDWEEAEQQFETFRRTGERSEPGEPRCLPQNTNRVHKTRRLTLYQDAADKVLEVYVSGGVATIIRLPAKLAARGTRLGAGGERRFKLLMGGDQILITPTRQLAQGERFPFVVVLADGTVIPLSLTRAPGTERTRTDGELWLDREPASPEQLRIRLASMTERAKGFEASYRQALKEQESEDFLLAGLMAGGSSLTGFDQARKREFMAIAGGTVTLLTYAPRPDAESATDKVVAVFWITHQGKEPMGPLTLSFGRANPGGDAEPPMFRAQPSVIPPGGEGRLAVVLDRALFGSDGTVTLTFSDKHEVVQLSADLSLEDFRAPGRSGSWWWPF